MVTVLISLLVGATLGGLGLLVVPKELRPRTPWRVLGISLLGALPGAVLGLFLVEDLLLDTHAMALFASIVGSTLAVLGAAFLPREGSTLDVVDFEGTMPSGAKVQLDAQPGFFDGLAWLWRVKASRRARALA